MEAGPELDWLVAKHIMGWKEGQKILESLSGVGILGEKALPRYSTDIAAAWEIVENRRRWGWTWKMTGITGHWRVALYDEGFNFLAEARAAELTVAICRAALLAVMEVGNE